MWSLKTGVVFGLVGRRSAFRWILLIKGSPFIVFAPVELNRERVWI